MRWYIAWCYVPSSTISGPEAPWARSDAACSSTGGKSSSMSVSSPLLGSRQFVLVKLGSPFSYDHIFLSLAPPPPLIHAPPPRSSGPAPWLPAMRAEPARE